MIHIKEPNESNVVVVTVEGKIRREDYRQELPVLEKIMEDGEIHRFFIKLENVTGFEAGALWEDLKYDLKHKDQYGKTAVVGDRKWEEYAIKISDLFFKAEMAYFAESRADEAWKWVNE